METLSTSSTRCLATIKTSSSPPPTTPLSILSPRRRPIRSRPLAFPLASSKNNEHGGDYSDPNSKDINSVPVRSDRNHFLSPFSQDAAMGLVLNAATERGWTTGSGLEGPSSPAETESKSGTENVSTFPWSLFTKSPRRRMLVAFTCNICGQRTTRAINPHAYTDGTVFVQCCGCSAFHKLVDNLNLFHEMKCYVNPSFNYRGNGWEDGNVKYMGMEGNDDIFPLQ